MKRAWRVSLSTKKLLGTHTHAHQRQRPCSSSQQQQKARCVRVFAAAGVCTRSTQSTPYVCLQAGLQASVGTRRHTACGLACSAPAVRRGGPCRYRDPAAPPDAAAAQDRSYASSSQQGLQQQADHQVQQDKDRRLPTAFRGKAVVVGAGPAGALPRWSCKLNPSLPACLAAVLRNAALCRTCILR